MSADLENGFGDDPQAVAETVSAALAAGLAGCSIEDFTGREDDPIYELEHAVAESAPRRRPPTAVGADWYSPPARRTTCTAGRTSPTQSSGCSAMPRPAPMSCTHRD